MSNRVVRKIHDGRTKIRNTLRVRRDKSRRCVSTRAETGKRVSGAPVDFVRNLGKVESAKFVHVFKTLLAVIAAIGISMRLELAAPRTAAVTVVILMMHRHSGMVIARGFYRALGMLVGNVVAMILIVMFAQARVLFLLGLSMWIGVCVYGAAYFRNYQSYGCVLAGYATCIAALPSIDDPYAIFDNVVTGLSEVSLGVICASVVSAVILPESVQKMLFRTGERHFVGFLAFVRSTLLAELSLAELGNNHFRLIGERANLENLRSAAVFEDAELRARNDSMELLARRYLDAGARFHSLCDLRRRLAAMPDTHASAALDGLCLTASVAMDTGVTADADLSVFESLANELDQWLRVYSQLAQRWSATIPDADRLSLQQFESGAVLLEAAVKSLRLYLDEFIAIRRPIVDRARGARPARLASSTHRLVAAAAGARAVVVIGAVSLFWLASGWKGAVGAVSAAGISSALYSVMPTPVNAVRQAIIGCLLAWIASLYFNFYLLPRFDGFAGLALALAPFILFGSYLNRLSTMSGIGLAFNLYFCFLANFTNPEIYALSATLDTGFSTLVGIAASAAGYAIVAPYGGSWVTRLHLRRLRSLVAKEACHGPLEGLMQRFDGHLRDFVPHVEARAREGIPGRKELLAWLFASIEIGRALIDVRETARNADLAPSWHVVERRLCHSISNVFSAPSARLREEAAAAASEALSALGGYDVEHRGHSRTIASLRASLTFIGVALQDDSLLPRTATYSGRAINQDRSQR